MTRRLPNLLTTLSLLVCVGLTALWVRSYSQSQFLGWSNPSRFVGALSMAGLLRFEHGSYPGDDPGWSYVSYPTPPGTTGGAPTGLWGEVTARDRRGGWLRRLGIAWVRIDYTADGTHTRRALYVPHWLPTAAALALPSLRLGRSLRSRRRRAAGTCPACGYDLRATPDRCPECGTAPALDR